METDNLTRTEAQARSRLVTNAAYTISLSVTGDPKDEVFISEATLSFDAAEDANTFVNLCAKRVTIATVNGVDISKNFDGVRIANIPVRSGRNEIHVSAECEYRHTGVGMHRVVDPVDGEVYLYTHCEPFDAHKVYACFDQPDIKATFSIRVTAPEKWHVVSNYPEEQRDGNTRIFATTPTLPTYLAAVIAGPYHVVRDEHAGVPLAIYCRTSLAEYLDPDEFFDITKRGLDFYNQYFDYPYPFAKYDQLMVPEFNVGAMEHPGAVTFNEIYVFRSKVTEGTRARRANTILHEMAHMWFGDLVTMRWWDDLWLNESFAEYMAHHAAANATRWINAWVDFANTRKQWALLQDQLPSTHPIAADMVDTEAVRLNFDGITYAKGASVLRQLVAYVGEDAFQKGIRSYFKKFAWGNATLADFLKELSLASGRDLDSWSNEWLETSGVATLRPQLPDNNGIIKDLEVQQEVSADYPTLRSQRLRIGLFNDDGSGKLTRSDYVELDIAGASTPVPQLNGAPRPALLLLNDGDLTFAKIRLDDISIDTVVASLSQIDDPLARALCFTAAWDMTRDAELPTRRFVDLICAHAATETEITVLERLVGQVLRVIDVYGDPTYRLSARRQVAEAARRNFADAERGSDLQLAWARCAIASSDTPAHLEEIRSWLDVEETSGLRIDTDLRWSVVGRLAAAGVATTADIDAEAERDPTDIGARRAAGCRAARPLADAKAEAWRLLTEERDLPLQTGLSIIAGFSQPDQTELLEPYVARYKEAAPKFWKDHDAEAATAYMQGLFPEYIVTDEVLDLADSLLASELPPPAIRILKEARDNVKRAQRARAADAAASGEPVTH